jgi:hypothetical protein
VGGVVGVKERLNVQIAHRTGQIGDGRAEPAQRLEVLLGLVLLAAVHRQVHRDGGVVVLDRDLLHLRCVP